MPKGFIQPIIYKDAWHRDLAKAMMAIYYEVIFKPLLDILADPMRKDNAKTTSLEKALRDGSVQFKDGAFRGEINAKISKEIKEFGGKFSKGAWRIPSPSLPSVLQKAIFFNKVMMELLFERVRFALDSMPEKIIAMVENMDLEKMGMASLNRVSIEFKHKINQAYSVYPDLGKKGKQKFKLEYTDTETKPIKEKLLGEYARGTAPACRDFAFEEIQRLRQDLDGLVFGGRPRSEIKNFIQSRLNVSANRAKFIARQETALATVEFTKIQYQSAGVNKYQWITVGDHVVRGTRKSDSGNHVVLDRNIYSWDNPPSADHFSTGTPCHPGQDYNCRCLSKPIVEW